ncbi:hypothetical protein ACB092_11G235900 [Castanea dentata]
MSKSWQTVYSMENPLLSPTCPLLLLAEEKEQKSHTRVFYNLFDDEFYNFKLPELAGKICIGTSFGWLLSVGTDFQMNLFHPLSKHQLSLPPHPYVWEGYNRNFELDPIDYSDIFLYKCVLSSSPWNSVTHEYDRDCIIMIIHTNYKTLAFTRPGYKAWIDIKCDSPNFYDITFYKGKFYAVNNHGDVLICHIEDDIAFTEHIAIYKETEDYIHKYLVELSGDLLLVSRIQGGTHYQDNEFIKDESKDENLYVTLGFTVLKLECSTEVKNKNEYKWVNVDSLGDQALFVGGNSSVSLSASSFNGCKANCIYFTDDNFDFFLATLNGGGYNMGVFSMEDGNIKQHYREEFLSYFAPPVWYI